MKLGEAAFQLVIDPRGIQFPAVGDLPEGGSPGIKELNILVFQLLILHIALQGIDFGNGVADRRSGHEVHAAPIVLALQVATLDEQIERLGGTGDVAEAGDVHCGLKSQIFELMTFIHKERVHPQIRKVHILVFLACRSDQFLVAVFHLLPLLFQLFDGGTTTCRLF